MLTERPAAAAPRGTGGRPPRVLVLTPTRELAAQVEDSVRTYGKHLRVRSTTVFGGVSAVNQARALRDGVDILVATPGRLLDHLGQRTVDLSRVEILVLDEADRMLDMGFIRDIRKVLAVLPPKRQNLLFSATFSDEIRGLAGSFLTNPAEVSVAPANATTELVSQVVHPVDKARKRDLLTHLINTGDWRQVLVFTRTKHGANRLSQELERAGISSAAIHGNKSQNARTRALQGFKDGEVRVLVATDIAARGLDIEELPHVVNYELPNIPEDYVHRIGRTGRAGNSGQACSLVCGEESSYLRDIERLMKRSVERLVVRGFEPVADGLQDLPPPPQGGRTQRRGGPQPSGRGGQGQGNRSGRPAREPRQPSVQARGRGEGSSPRPRRDDGQPSRPRSEAPRDAGRAQATSAPRAAAASDQSGGSRPPTRSIAGRSGRGARVYK